MRKFAFVVVGLVLLIVIGLLAAPLFIDVNRFRPEIAARASAALGRTVRIDGPLAISLLPVPTVSVSDVHVANAPNAQAKDLLVLPELDLRLAPLPLLAGRIVATSLVLVEPVLDLERLPDGSYNWSRPAKTPPPTSGRSAPAEAAPSGKTAVTVQKLDIRGGRVIYRHDKSVERLEKLDAKASMGSLQGPLQVSGSAEFGGAPFTFEADAGRVGAERTPVHLLLQTQPGGRLELAAEVAGDGTYTGRLTLRGDSLARLAARFGHTLPATFDRSFDLAGNLAGSAQDVKLDKLSASLGDATGSGKASLTFGAMPALALSLALPSLDLDHWAAPAGQAQPGAAAAPPRPSPPQAAAASALPAAVSLPKNLRATVELGVEALVWRQGVVRQAHIEATLDKGTLTVSRATALLPGGSDVSLGGSLGETGGEPHFRGVFEADADNLRGLLHWLGVDFPDIPADRLRKASLTSRIEGNLQQVEVTGFDLGVDASRITGAATIALRARPGIGARLSLDRLNLDAYLPKAAAAAASAPSCGGGPAAAATPAASKPSFFDSFDANIDASANTVTWRGQPIRGLHFAGTLQQGDLTIRDASAKDLVGASLKVSGRLAGLGGQQPQIQTSSDLRGPELERLVRLFAPSTAIQPLGPFTLSAKADGDLSALKLDADLAAVGGTVKVAGTAGANGVDLTLDAKHPSAGRLLALLAPGYRPSGGDPGPLGIHLTVAGNAQRLRSPQLAVTLGPTAIKGSASLDRTAKRPHLSAELSFNEITVDRLLPTRQTADAMPHLLPGVQLAQAGSSRPPAISPRWSRAPINLSALGLLDADLKLSGDRLSYRAWRLDHPAATVALSNSVLDLGSFAAGVFGGRLAANGQLAAGGTPTIKANVTLRDADLKQGLADAAGIGRIEGRADLDLALTANGRSPLDLISSLAGQGKLAARDGTVYGIDLPAASKRLDNIDRVTDILDLARAAASGSTHFSTLTGTFAIDKGVARSDDIKLVADAADGNATATIDLPRWTLQSRVSFRLTEHASAPPLVVTLEGPLDDPRKVLDINPLEKWLAQRGIERLLRNRAAPQPQAPGGSAPPQSPEKALQNLLKNLIR